MRAAFTLVNGLVFPVRAHPDVTRSQMAVRHAQRRVTRHRWAVRFCAAWIAATAVYVVIALAMWSLR